MSGRRQLKSFKTLKAIEFWGNLYPLGVLPSFQRHVLQHSQIPLAFSTIPIEFISILIVIQKGQIDNAGSHCNSCTSGEYACKTHGRSSHVVVRRIWSSPQIYTHPTLGLQLCMAPGIYRAWIGLLKPEEILNSDEWEEREPTDRWNTELLVKLFGDQNHL